ncbi:hypothetical protein APHAL10511_004472 [Amanita phalloides]|nr:hypothetical protein APHAL10511_004472 [Amanita phalloides]
MDFSKLSLSKRQTKLSMKAQASVQQGTNPQINGKQKRTNGEDTPVPPKKGRLSRPNGSGHMLSNKVSNPHPLTTTESMRSVSLMSSSGSMGDKTSSMSMPSDRDTLLLTREMGGSSVGNSAIVVGDSEDEDVDMGDEVEVEKVVEPKEKLEEQLVWLMKEWTSPVYAFFQPKPKIDVVVVGDDECVSHVFKCWHKQCKVTVCRFLDKKDTRSTSNMHKHVKACWGDKALVAADSAANADDVRTFIVGGILKNGSITDSFERKGKGKRTYSIRALTCAEVKAEIVRWPELYIPSLIMVACDMQLVFTWTRQRVAKYLNAYDGRLSFTTDAWTSPNHWAYVAMFVHLENNGTPSLMILDIVEVAESHSGANLAAAFAKILEDFDISHKILSITCNNALVNNKMINELCTLVPEFDGWATHTCCFLHTANLVAKSIIHMFDVNKKGKTSVVGQDDVAKTIEELSKELEHEEEATTAKTEGVDAKEAANNNEGLIDLTEEMEPKEHVVHEEHICPVKLVLVKLRKLAFKIINSTTILLPAWYDVLADLQLD